MTSFNFRQSELVSKTFLVVDDFGDMRGMLRSMLSTVGVKEIDTANNGPEAIDALERRRYDIVLCDYNLGPGKNGQQVLEEARHRQLIGLDAIFVMITAENTREMVMGAVEYEPDSYLTKPFTKDVLKTRLEKLVLKRQDLREVDQAVGEQDYDKAIQLLDNKIAARPGNLGELTKLKAEILFRSSEYEYAADVYERVLAVREMPWARLGLGKIYFTTGRLQEAQAMFEGLLQDNQRFTAAYDWLARTLQALKKDRDAQEVLERAVVVSPKAILRQKALGDIALANGDLAVAGKALTEAVSLGRHSVYKSAGNYAKLARVKSKSGDGQGGLKIIENMEREFQGEGESELYSAMVKGVIHADMGNREKADACMHEAARLYAKEGPHVAADLTLEMARSYGELGDKQEAAKLLQQAVRNNHAEPELLQQIENMVGEFDLGTDPKAFVSDIRKEIVKLNNRGVELAKAGKLQEAVGLFSEAVEAMPSNKVVNLNAARVLVMNMRENGVEGKQLGRVRELLDRVRKIEPDSPSLRRVQLMYQNLSRQGL
ncbi:MAG: response regulator [Gammaproteobacteria bacterium]|nr:response regulator [Gammaproteobacteria bacterium]